MILSPLGREGTERNEEEREREEGRQRLGKKRRGKMRNHGDIKEGRGIERREKRREGIE